MYLNVNPERLLELKMINLLLITKLPETCDIYQQKSVDRFSVKGL